MVSDFIKTLPQYVLPKQGLTSLAGLLANVKSPAIKNALIKNFIKKYDVNMQEALEENPEAYACFNDFFIRHLKADARPIANADIISPVDGFISEIGKIDDGKLIQAKKKYYSIEQLLANHPDSKKFAHGLFATLYLSPKDYHRVHMPLDSVVDKMIYIPGRLFSVQPTTARVIPHLFAKNERLVVFFKTSMGPMAMVLVGATIVGGIGTSWSGDIIRGPQNREISYDDKPAIKLAQAAEMGYFKLGSTVVLLFGEGNNVSWLPHLFPGKPIRFGEALGNFNPMSSPSL